MTAETTRRYLPHDSCTDRAVCLSVGVYLAVAVWGAGDAVGGVEACVAVLCGACACTHTIEVVLLMPCEALTKAAKKQEDWKHF